MIDTNRHRFGVKLQRKSVEPVAAMVALETSGVGPHPEKRFNQHRERWRNCLFRSHFGLSRCGE